MTPFLKAGFFSLLAVLCLSGCASSEVRARREAARTEARSVLENGTQEGLYRVIPGDGLKIEFLDDEELTRGVTVRPDGYVSLPLVNDVQVSGMTVPQVREALVTAYTGILKKPVIVVSVEHFGGKIFVAGEVSNPGIFMLDAGVTALRAIAMAGGVRTTAGLNSVLIIRDQGTPEPEYLMIDLKAGTTGLDPEQDLPLKPKDIVLVPKSGIATANQFVEQYMNQLLPFQKSASVSYVFGRATY